MITYGKRENVFEKGERTWTVQADALRRRDPGGAEAALPWAGVREIRLTYAPTRFKPWRHKLTVVNPDRGTWTVDNVHFRGPGSFEDRSATFNPFVLACVEQVAAAAPTATARLGAAPLAYWAQVLFVVAMFALLAAVVMALPVVFSGMVWLKLLLIAAMLPVFFAFTVRSWPRRAPLDPEVFREALPRAEA